MPFSSLFSSGRGRFSVLLIIIGILLGIDAGLQLNFVHKLWPLLITLIGSGFVGLFFKRNAREWFFIAVGTYLICFSGLALYLSFAGWANTAKLWPFFIGILGIAFISAGFGKRRRKLRLLLGLILVSVAAVLHFVFFIDPNLWWTSFLLAGASILIAELAG